MATVFLGLGSNLGDRRATIEAALARVDTLPETGVVAVSELSETEPVGVTDQPRFLNGVACLETELEPDQLLAGLQAVEDELGRVRGERWGPRTIDLDILLYDDLVLRTKALTLPHPRLAERRFVLEPLAELAPGTRHPVLQKTVAELLTTLTDGPVEPGIGVSRAGDAP